MNYQNKCYVDFLDKVESAVSKEEVANIVDQYIKWKIYDYPALWRKDFYKDGKCPECGSNNLIHYLVNWEWDQLSCVYTGIWKTECPDCDTEFVCISTEDGDLLDDWTNKIEPRS